MEFDDAENGLGMGFGGRGVLREINKNDGGIKLSPLAVKPSPKPTSMDQQKAMAAALGHQTAVPGGLKPEDDLVPKFGGLPEFDETQIPELAPLSTDMDTQLKSNHSDSDVFVECLSLHSERYTGDRSELEAYSSALNDVLEQQLSMTSVSTLGAEFNDPLAVSQHNNVSYEAMDVDDLNETMEMLKDVLNAEDRHLMQTHILSVTQSKPENNFVHYHPNQEQNRVELDQLAKHSKPNSDAKESESLVESVLSEESGTQSFEPKLTLSALDSTKDLAKHQEEMQTNTKDIFQKEKHHPVSSAQVKDAQNPKEPEKALNLKEASSELSTKSAKSLEYPNQEKQFSVAVESMERPCTAISLEQNASPAMEATEDRTVEELDQMDVDESMKVDDATLLNSCRQEQINAHSPVSSKFFLKLCVQNDTDCQDNKMDQKTAGKESALKMTEIELPVESVPSASLSPPTPALQAKMIELSLSPPIPTHRPKTAEELEFLALRELPLPDGVSTAGKVECKQLSHGLVPIVAVLPTPLYLDLKGNTTTASLPEPTSPSFPIKEPAEKQSHFPRSPRAQLEQKDMPYLEEAVVERSSHRKQSDFGVIAKSPIVFELTQPSPEKQHLNETLPMSEISPTSSNMTFDSGSITEDKSQKGTENIEPSSTLAVSLGSVDDKQRRTFSVVQPTKEEEEAKSRRTFCMENENPRRTFCMQQNASPAVEATEDTGADEVMDVDISMRADEVAVMKSHQQTWKERQAPISNSPPIPTHQRLNRPPEAISPVSPLGNGTVVLEEQTLSAKEQATLSASDEKDDVFLEHFGAISPVSDDMFKTSSASNNQAKFRVNADEETGGKGASAMIRKRSGTAGEQEEIFDAEFHDGVNNQNLILNSSDFDYLYTKGSNSVPIDRSSLLLKFDPLLGAPVPVNHPNQQEQALQNILGSNQHQNRLLSPTLEEHETSDGNQSFGVISSAKDTAKKWDFKPPVDRTKKHVKMSVDVIDNDCNKTFDNSNTNTEDKTHNYNDMDELEKKIKNEVTRSEDIEKKLKEGELREEALIKRITEKDKTNAKLNGVIEAYEKAIAELISEKEQQAQLHERQLQEVQADRDANYHHLTSLETTFSDLHVKYEKSKEMTSQLKSNEESLLAERKQMMDNLRLQEQRYDKMKNHAMQQLEIANKKLDTYSREHADETKKLKALLKKEEISRVSMTEQLQQKSRENADLLKICEELIYGKGQGGSS